MYLGELSRFFSELILVSGLSFLHKGEAVLRVFSRLLVLNLVSSLGIACILI